MMSEFRKRGKSYPVDKVLSFLSIESQVERNLSQFNFFEDWREPQKAYWVFARLLERLKHDPKHRVKLDWGKVDQFLDLFYGNGKEDAPPKERGLYALDIISREFTEQDELGNVCRGYAATRVRKAGRWIIKPVVSPSVHHSLLMWYYKRLNPLLYFLWHQIAEEVEGGQFRGVKLKWIGEKKTEDEQAVDAGLQKLRDQELAAGLLNSGRVTTLDDDEAEEA